ncbi:ABC transporter substrate-binding protein [Demequina zhanjiangensis]|uniref:ABC transporter substrate-binding protein n=1 Tax=Demequina zhanjiangensis TaxID=3051659 RepID=A0ABT8G1Q8_9MICO|nr:ABC transporter substrate-binding protein [Demequina sp. SYSU T00b26]MDN4473063.1 ABC transporter substrate-binding protein [Demequina sp. SYSU T00b26]
MRSQSNTRRGATRAAALVVGALVALTACSTSGDTDASESASASPTVDAPTTVTLSLERQPATFDPINLSEGTDMFIWSAIYDTLLYVGEDGSIEPRAAESWEYSDDGLVLTLKLRDDLTFSDGTPATAADYKATAEYVMSTPGAGQGQFVNWESVDAPDDTTIVITLKQVDPTVLRSLAARVGIIAKPDLMTEESYGLDPIGSGPYVLDTEATTTGSVYVLNKREDHWSVDNWPFDTVTFRVIQDTTAIENALRAGELDFAPIQTSSRGAVEGLGLTVTEFTAQASTFIKIFDRAGTMVPALADVRVRQALNMAFDRQAFVDGLLGGVGQATEQMFYPTTGAFDESLNDTYAYDVEGAKALLAEAGYADGFAVTMPSLVYTAQMEPNVTQALADIGVTVDWVAVPAQDTVQAVVSGQYPMTIWFDGQTIAAKSAEGHYTTSGFLNPMQYEEPEVTALLTDALSELDPDAADAKFRELNELVVDEAWDIPLYFTGQLWAAQDGYEYVGTEAEINSTLDRFGVTVG